MRSSNFVCDPMRLLVVPPDQNCPHPIVNPQRGQYQSRITSAAVRVLWFMCSKAVQPPRTSFHYVPYAFFVHRA